MSETHGLDVDEEPKTVRLRHFIANYLNKFFIDHIPIESFKDLPTLCK
jgi:hypothetical protein